MRSDRQLYGDGCAAETKPGYRLVWVWSENDFYVLWIRLPAVDPFAHSQRLESIYISLLILCEFCVGRAGIWPPQLDKGKAIAAFGLAGSYQG
jgi:hypothetical protein